MSAVIKPPSATENKSKDGAETSVGAKSEEGNTENIEVSRFPKITCQEDVITNFFNQIVEFVIQDMIIIEPEEDEVAEGTQEDELIVKDYKDLATADLSNAEIVSVNGSKVTLKKSTSRESLKNNQSSAHSKLNTIKEETSERSRSKTSTTCTSLQDPLMEEEREVKIFFVTGNTYEGRIAKRIMNGKGKYVWANGTVYEVTVSHQRGLSRALSNCSLFKGNFVDGFPTGQGEMTLPDLSNYKGGFNQGLFEGDGFLNIVSTPTFYSGQWKHGMKHGQGWLLYGPGDWYEGGWRNDLKEGFGVRQYKSGAKYRGFWQNGKYDGEGIMIWENSDYYKGGWSGGAMHGDGEYIWKAFYNKAFAFPIQNIYRGSWKNGKRCGEGIMHFGGDSGARLKGTWDQDFKHGDGCLVCGNGLVVDQPSLFHYDKPVLPHPSATLFPDSFSYQVMDVPVFTIPEQVDVGYYIDKILEKIQNVDQSKFEKLKLCEARCIKNTIIAFLPQLNDLYKEYASMAAKIKLHYEPILIRMFLWQFYRDVEVYKRGLSLVDTDLILANNPKSSVENIHYPFEPIYFWQFLMSLVGVALMTSSLDDTFDSSTQGGVMAYIIKKFFEKTVFARQLDIKDSLMFTYMDLVPIKDVYLLYQKLGEPHTAKAFLRHTCTRKGEVPILCNIELHLKKSNHKSGVNLIPLPDYITFIKSNN
ncbi:radial spoke head 10 -like B-like [Asbolus verrucosus]|uniref:Radial spoke head 10-like B-like n=1 Tax=Asbolus verrucosus TaxID=1661398 RepID=A0A482VLS6_ASBVE|nr:radial spoke head 10 -like B-like [Asbolus verrucosus]